MSLAARDLDPNWLHSGANLGPKSLFELQRWLWGSSSPFQQWRFFQFGRVSYLLGHPLQPDVMAPWSALAFIKVTMSLLMQVAQETWLSLLLSLLAGRSAQLGAEALDQGAERARDVVAAACRALQAFPGGAGAYEFATLEVDDAGLRSAMPFSMCIMLRAV